MNYLLNNSLKAIFISETTKGVTTTSNGIDTYYTSTGTKKLRLNTMMNPYGFPDGEENGNKNI